MLISLNKNRWLLEWMRDQWSKEVTDIMLAEIQHPPTMMRQFAILLNDKGYTAKTVKNDTDILISLVDEEYTYLKLRYY